MTKKHPTNEAGAKSVSAPETPNHQVTSGLTPYLTVQGARKAIAFYEKAFGATCEQIHPADDGERLMHAHLLVNKASIMLSDWFAEYSDTPMPPIPAGIVLHLEVDDPDFWFARAVKAGAQVVMELADQFWGDRYGQVRDPFGHVWSIGAPISN